MKLKRKIDQLNQKVQKLRQQLAGAKKQQDEPGEIAKLSQELAAAEADLAKLKAEES